MRRLFIGCLIVMTMCLLMEIGSASPLFHIKKTLTTCIGKETKSVCKAQYPRNKKLETQHTNFCWRYVKLALVRSYMVSEYPRTSYAKNAGYDLKREGFINIMTKGRTAHDAPEGAVLVYKGGKYGHVEIRGYKKNAFYSDFKAWRKPDDAFFKRRKLIGIWIKE